VLNRLRHERVGRLIEAPAVHARLLQELKGATYAYVRLPSWVGLMLLRCAWFLGRPYLVSLHGDWGRILDDYAERASGPLTRTYYLAAARYVRMMVRQGIRGARHTFVVGERLGREYGGAGTACTVYQDSTHRGNEVWPLRPLLRAKELRVLFVGELTEAKGVTVLMRALVKLKQAGIAASARFVGQGPLLEWLRREACELGVDVQAPGWVPHGPAFDRFFQEADLLVLPSYTEGVPRVLVEAMMRATPVLATPVGDVPALLADGTRGWLTPVGDEQRLAGALREIATNPGEAERRVVMACEFVRQYDADHWRTIIRAALTGVEPRLALSEEGAC
jgi:glycosyltransferase involved in cell wall biosynthesis